MFLLSITQAVILNLPQSFLDFFDFFVITSLSSGGSDLFDTGGVYSCLNLTDRFFFGLSILFLNY